MKHLVGEVLNKQRHSHPDRALDWAVNPAFRPYAHCASDVVECRTRGQRQLSGRRVCYKVVEVVRIPTRVRDVLQLSPEG